ncbi:alpha/beta fold hydrolase [Albimonas sp. CAU 1670]|uniref:alpha/beta fold hydrolase n=1 Tax=Albimonas sp. CAU 1670 TaxID=3032599 RepID=UPI0023DC471D|nr:alpha/beta fold hydrolase [Albimonas sp. CAU 1670]MDF2233482.1 alpha/beta fold hydrolase [Albimonas sp. CAU 1670]
MRLNAIVHEPQGAETKPPLVIAHGLFGSARNWGAVAKRLSEGRRVIAVDMRNHGDSPWSDDHSYAGMAEDLEDALETHGGGEADLLGHSMGGKAAMTLAVTRAPAALRRLVVADIAPVAYRHSHLAYVEAMLAVDLGSLSRRSEVEPLIADAVPDRSLRAFLLHSLASGPDGLRWKLNLVALRDWMGSMVGFEPLEGSWPGETLFLRGGASDYADDAGLAAAKPLFPAMEVATLPGAGHWLHAEQPAEFSAAAAAFLDR